MTDDEIFDAVQRAVIFAKSEVVALTPAQIDLDTALAEPPIYLDSLEFIAMVTYLEEAFGLIAEDDHLTPKTMRTVRGVVATARTWVAGEAAAWK